MKLSRLACLALLAVGGCYRVFPALEEPDGGPERDGSQYSEGGAPDVGAPEGDAGGASTCAPAVCFPGAPTVCLDELAADIEDDARCRDLEIVSTSDDCEETAGRLHVAMRVPDARYLWVEWSIVERDHGPGFSGFASARPEEACNPCSYGITDSSAAVGREFGVDLGLGEPGPEDYDFVFAGRGVRYQVRVCAHD